VRLASYNIQYGRGRDGVFDLQRIATAVDGADVIALQEVERYWQRSGMRDQPRERDFNMQPDSEEYARITGPVSPYGGRITNPQGFVDAWVAAGNEELDGVTATIDGREVRLDYRFVSASLSGAITGARIDAQAAGSDHQPLWVEIDLD